MIVKINQGLDKIDKFRIENFKLKQQIACEKKRYLDLRNSYIELK